MHSVKRPRNTSESENGGKKEQCTNDEKGFYITNFEDMSNELVYEIFEYFDMCHAYEAFSNLNTRFQSLLIYSPLPFRVNFSFTCKSIFQRRCEYIVMPNIHRIVSLRLCHYLSNNLFFTLYTIDSSFVQLQSLIFDNLNVTKVADVLSRLALLPRLTSLIIRVNDHDDYDIDVGHFYRLIFRLPVLKYGKFSFWPGDSASGISIAQNEQQQYSPIEHLIIDGFYCPHELSAIFSYTPWLRYFSCDSISSSAYWPIDGSIVPSYLTHLSIEGCMLSFDEFELFIVKICSQLKVLRITPYNSSAYLNANRWERLISHHMYRLSIFDFQVTTWMENVQEYHATIDQFVSPFWIKRRWFFAHQHHCPNRYVTFYSTQPYRRKRYDIFERTDNDTCSYRESGVNWARNINIKGHHLISDCSVQFVRVTKLTFGNLSVENNNQFITNLNHRISLTQISKLQFQYRNLSTSILIELLCCMPNIISLKLHYCRLQHVSTWSPRQETQITQLVSKNKITKMIISDQVINKPEDLQFLMNLCPRIEYLETRFGEDNSLEFISQIILSKHINSNSHLFSILIWNRNHEMAEKLRTWIDRDKVLHNDYTFEHIDQYFHLWW